MSHIKSRSSPTFDYGPYRNQKETLFDKHGRVLGKYDGIKEADHAAKLISDTSEIKPRRKPRNCNPKGCK